MQPRDFPEMVKKDLAGWYMDKYPALPSVLEEFCETDTLDASEGDYDSGTVVSSLGGTKIVPVGQEAHQDEIRETFTWYLAVYPHRTALSYNEDIVNWPKWKREKRLEKDGAEIARIFNRDENILAADVFNHGALTAGDKDTFNGTPHSQGQTDPYPKFIYDGNPFFYSAHPLTLDATQTFANRLASTDLNYAGIETAELLVKDTNAYNERGQKIEIIPDTIMVPNVLKRTAQQLLDSQNETDKDFGNTNVYRGAYRLIVNPYLDGTSSATAAWYMGLSNMGVTFVRQGDVSINVEYDGMKRQYNVDIMKVFGVVVKNWRYWVGSKTPTS